MCGIVGYTGPENPKDIILSGLKSLEYRGYDSAGVAILHKGSFKRVRAEGKLSQLAQKLNDEVFDGHVGIGHTRWATHGEPNETNAHPHKLGPISIVHNGIIENYAELKEELQKTGSEFESETDSELVAHLIYQKTQNEGMSLFDAVLAILPELTGAYSILAVSEDLPDEMVAFKNGPPLIIGAAGGEVIVASDLQAIMPITKDVVYLEDDEVGYIKNGHVDFYSKQGEPLDKLTVHIDWSPEQVEKQGYAHFMLKEIFEQPRAVANALEPHIDLKNHTIKLKKIGFSASGFDQLEHIDIDKDAILTEKIFKTVERVFIVACGTSYYAGMVGEYLIEKMAGIPVEIDFASEFRYRHAIIPENSLVIVISQSGETADTLAALRQVKKLNSVKVLSICNVKRSTIDREADGHLYMNAGVEIGVASTKAFVSTLSIMNLVAMGLAKAKSKLSLEEEKQYVEQLLAVPSQMEKVLAYDKFFKSAADTLKNYKGFLYMGRGVNYPIALEGALKLKELAYMHAEGYAAGEMKHGPLALIDSQMAIVMLAPKDDLYEKTVSNLEEAKARGGVVISIGTGEDEKLKRLSRHYLSLPEANWTTNPLLEVLPLQLLAYHVANSLEYDVDQPRNLAKSVTVE